MAPLFAPHQIAACNFAIDEAKGRAVISLEVGKGKSAVGTTLAKYWGGNVLFICLKTKIEELQDEALKWNDLELVRYEKPTKRSAKHAKICSSAMIVSFDTAKRAEELQEMEWTTIVVDEAQKLKGDGTQVSEVVLRLLKKARNIVLLTATPIEVRVSDLFNMFHAIDCKRFPDRREFSARYANGKMMEDTWVESGVSNREELVELMKQYVFRQSTDGPELPFHRHIVPFAIDGPVPVKQRKNTIKAKQIEVMRIWRETQEAKHPSVWPLIRDGLRKVPKYQCGMVFFSHVEPAKKFHEWIQKELGIEVVYVDGDVESDERKKLLAPCITGEISCAVVSIRSVGTGLNMSPGVTHLFFPELPSTYALVHQAEGRAKRLGTQRFPVHSFWFVARGSYDEDHYKKLIDGQAKLISDTTHRV